VLNLLKIWIPVASAAMMILAGCINDDYREPLPDEGGELAGDVYIRFQMTLGGNGVSAAARASSSVEAIPDDETPGTDKENKVNAIGLLIYDAASNLLTDCIYLGEDQISQILSDVGLVVPIYSKTEQSVYIYAVVNPTERMRRQFSSGQNAFDFVINSNYDDYRDVIDEFVPGSAGHQTELESNRTAGIPMTGIFREAGHSDNLITIDREHSTRDNPLTVTVDVSRIVAKVHVLASTEKFTLSDGSVVEYAHAEDKTSQVRETAGDGRYANWIGWIRLSDVRYIPNGMNKSTYIFPHEDEDGKLMDLNMDLTAYVSGNRFDRSLYGSKFVFYDGVALHRANISSAGNLAQAEAFDQARLDISTGSDDPGRYTRGMYCLENYFDTPADDAFFADYDAGIPVVTHVSIAARLTPRNIVVAQDYADKMDAFVTAFENNPDTFRRTYGLTSADFTDADAARWKNVLRERYFGEAVLPGVYRGNFRIVRTLSEADAADLINWSLMANSIWSGDVSDFEKGKYPAGTFYVYDTDYDMIGGDADDVWTQRYLYLTAGAVNNATDDNIRIKTYSVPHVGGWGYYYTYLDQLGQTAADGVTPYTSSQVTRNTYYLVTVANFGIPGGTITHPEHIKVNTVPVGWVYEGKGDINLH